jgi:hypothetical protein
MGTFMYFLLWLLLMLDYSHSDCLLDQQRYDKAFYNFYPECKGGCEKEKLIYEVNFYVLFPACRHSNLHEIGENRIRNLSAISGIDNVSNTTGLSNKLVRRRRLEERYSLCNISSNGEYTQTANCSITSVISVSGTLKITGVLDSNGAKPAIDGGWDGVVNSNTGVGLFYVDNGDELTIENMILTSGDVSIFRPFLILLITFVLFT